MAVNDLTFNQLATVLAAITAQATGKASLTPVSTSEFVSVANTALKTGYDPLNTAISQVLSRTIFSARPYSRKFPGFMVDTQKFGNRVRKLQVIDKPFENDARFNLADGSAIDQQIVNKPQVLETNYYGANVYEKSITIFKDQLDCAFSSPEEFGRFISMVMQNVTDMLEQARETTTRATIANFIGGKIKGDSDNVIHLLDVYNDETGATLTAATVHDPDNYGPFVKWLYGYIKTLSQLMTERSVKFHQNITGKEIMRHTPVQNQKLYLYNKEMNAIEASVLSGVFNDNYMKMIDHEGVSFWQSIETPMGIEVRPVFLNSTGGTISTDASNPVEQSAVLGILFDEDAMGMTTVNQWSAAAPFNAKGGYTNYFFHETHRYWNDFTENAVVLLLDEA